jgi:hypothetical protein
MRTKCTKRFRLPDADSAVVRACGELINPASRTPKRRRVDLGHVALELERRVARSSLLCDVFGEWVGGGINALTAQLLTHLPAKGRAVAGASGDKGTITGDRRLDVEGRLLAGLERLDCTRLGRLGECVDAAKEKHRVVRAVGDKERPRFVQGERGVPCGVRGV